MNNWTPDRPTKPGKYWLSVHPDKRPKYWPIQLEVDMDEVGRVYWEGSVINALLDGALWHPYVEPLDPFAEPVPSLRQRVEALPTYGYHGGLDEIARRRGGDYLKRSEVLALFEVLQ